MQAITGSTDTSITQLRDEAHRLRAEHSELKQRLGDLNGRVYLSPAEELEKKNLQKMKLAKKDRIAFLESNYGL
ncbi:MAG: YdcH family protein [Deltaproteobacteria bacterium]|nr:YdcH family protein [Deltaproteobacteria bacterium]